MTNPIRIEITDWDAARFDALVGKAVIDALGGSNYDDNEDDEDYSGRGLQDLARKVIKEQIAELFDKEIKAGVSAYVASMIDKVIGDGFKASRFGGAGTSLKEAVAAVFDGKNWSAPREHKQNGMTFIEFVAWTSTKGQIEDEAQKLVEHMRKDLSGQIAKNLGDQLASRMLKGG